MSDDAGHLVVEAMANATEIPIEAIGLTLLTPDAVAPDLLAAIARAMDAPELTQQDINIVYYGVYTLGARRVPGLQPILLRLLRQPDDRLDWLLGPVYIEPLPGIMAGAFDGDAQALFDLVCDVRADEMVRMMAFGVIAFLTWNGRISAETTRGFVRHYDASRLIPEGDLGWNGWEIAIELLGWEEFAPLVEAAYADGRLDTGMSELRLFREGIAAAAKAAPGDGARFHAQGYDYIEDALVAIDVGAPLLSEATDKASDEEEADWAAGPSVPRRNPLRHVGRNDPCPCGSGKKYKKCCLAV